MGMGENDIIFNIIEDKNKMRNTTHSLTLVKAIVWLSGDFPRVFIIVTIPANSFQEPGSRLQVITCFANLINLTNMADSKWNQNDAGGFDLIQYRLWPVLACLLGSWQANVSTHRSRYGPYPTYVDTELVFAQNHYPQYIIISHSEPRECWVLPVIPQFVQLNWMEVPKTQNGILLLYHLFNVCYDWFSR